MTSLLTLNKLMTPKNNFVKKYKSETPVYPCQTPGVGTGVLPMVNKSRKVLAGCFYSNFASSFASGSIPFISSGTFWEVLKVAAPIPLPKL